MRAAKCPYGIEKSAHNVSHIYVHHSAKVFIMTYLFIVVAKRFMHTLLCTVRSYRYFVVLNRDHLISALY